MKVSELIAKADMRRVFRANNLAELGWADGYLVVRFRGRPTLYIYGPNIAECERDKVLANPYPDALFTRLRNKHCWQCHKVEVAA